MCLIRQMVDNENITQDDLASTITNLMQRNREHLREDENETTMEQDYINEILVSIFDDHFKEMKEDLRKIRIDS